MLKKRIEKENLIKCIYASSTILASTFNKETSSLTVIFNNGGSYTYTGVKGSDYLRFETDDSQGRVLNSNIKQYPFIKNDSVDVGPIKEQLVIAENEEKAKIAQEMVDSMKTFIALIEGEDQNVSIKALSDVEASILLFKKVNRIVDAEAEA